jgi:signal transduction histidine kinase
MTCRDGDRERTCRVFVTPCADPSAGLIGYLFSSSDFGLPGGDHRAAEENAARMEVARQLAATMNHEVNNPLFVVSATLEDLLAEASDPAEQRRLNAALDAVWRVSEAVKKLSDIRQLVTTAYIEGLPMIDLEASQQQPEVP